MWDDLCFYCPENICAQVTDEHVCTMARKRDKKKKGEGEI